MNVDERNTRKVRKQFIIIISCVFTVIFTFIVVWFAYRQIKYRPFVENIPKTHGVHLTSKDDFSYSVSPFKLNFKYNLAVVNEETQEMLIIWPKSLSGYKYGAYVRTEDTNEQIMLIVDENGEFLGYPLAEKQSEIEAAEKAYQNNVDDIKDMLRRADEMWNLKEKDQ